MRVKNNTPRHLWALRSSGLFVGDLDGNLRYVARLEHTDEQGWHDGAFTLRAVNCHEALVEALQVALRESGCDGDLCNYRWHEKARAALALAEGES